MGAEGVEEKTETKPNPISEAQFLSWKRRKEGKGLCGDYRAFRISICVDKDPCAAASSAAHGNQGDLNFHGAETSARKAEAARKRSEDIAAGTVQMNGRELFLHEPWVFDNTNY